MQFHWKIKNREIELGKPILMGILNVTPDSFSDGGNYLDLNAAYNQALLMHQQGAQIIDVGGESTRPGSDEVDLDEELDRVIPVISKLSEISDLVISVDTRKTEVARKAIEAGAHIINDVEANREDSRMWELVASTGAGYVAMHMKGKPKTMQLAPEYQNPVGEVYKFFESLIAKLCDMGVETSQIVIDVGIGFGKTLEHNIELLSHLDSFHSLSCPQLIGVSRKSLFGKLFGLEVDQRLIPSLSTAIWAHSKGVKLFRVHDVKETRLSLETWDALQKKDKN